MYTRRVLNITSPLRPCSSSQVAELMQRLQKHLAPEGPAPRWPFFTFLVGAMVCLLFSALSHTLHCVSQPLSAFIWYVTRPASIMCSQSLYLNGIVSILTFFKSALKFPVEARLCNATCTQNVIFVPRAYVATQGQLQGQVTEVNHHGKGSCFVEYQRN